MKYKLDIKPLSVNEAWKGRRYKTDKYTAFQEEMLWILPNDLKLPKAPYYLSLTFGFSSSLSDIDNPIKMTLDSLQERYGFNDRDVKQLMVTKELTPKGQEYIEFELTSYYEPFECEPEHIEQTINNVKL